MRILIIAPGIGPYGGTLRFLERLMEIHRNQGITSALLIESGDSTGSGVTEMAHRNSVTVFRESNRNQLTTPPFLTPLLDLSFSIRTCYSWRPDLIIVSTGDPGRMSIVLYYPVPVIYVLHTVPELKMRILPRLYLRLSMMFNNSVLTVSQAAASAISKNMYIPYGKIAVVPNGCKPMSTVEVATAPIVLTVGHMVAYKNPETWFAVAKKVIQQRPDTNFVWVGDGELMASIYKKAASSKLLDRIHFPGCSNDPSIWFKQACVYFQPSLKESQGIAVLEAMAHGLPCVVSDVGGLPESVQNGVTGFVVHFSDVDGFSRAIIQLLDNSSNLRKQFGKSGLQRLNELFSEEQQEQGIKQLYEKMLGKGRSLHSGRNHG